MQLREKYPSRAPMFPYLPSKKYIGSSLSADIVDKRQRDLGYYMMSILHSSPLVWILCMLQSVVPGRVFLLTVCLSSWQLVQDEIIDSFLDIKRHILERVRERCNESRTVSTPTHTMSNFGGASPLRNP